jgi:hypothetical protein
MIGTYTVPDGGFNIFGKNNGYAINAGSAFTFPWLSTLARNFEKYRFTNLSFQLETASPTVYGGRLFMMLDLDTTDAPPVSVEQMMNSRYKASGVVYRNIAMDIGPAGCNEMHANFPHAFVKERDGADDYPRSSTVARLFVAGMVDQDSTVTLKVSYTVQLYTPQMLVVQDVESNVMNAGYNLTGQTQTHVPLISNLNPIISPVHIGAQDPAAGIDLSKNWDRVINIAAGLKDGSSTLTPGEMVSGIVWNLFDKNMVHLAQWDHADQDDAKVGAPRFEAYSSPPVLAAGGDVEAGFAQKFVVPAILAAYPQARFLYPLVQIALAARRSLQRPWVRVKTELR